MPASGADTRAEADAGTAGWEQALAECEARLVSAEAALENGDPVVLAPFAVPAVREALPPALVDRARACAARGEALQLQLAGELERIRLELRRLPRMPPAHRENRFDAQA